MRLARDLTRDGAQAVAAFLDEANLRELPSRLPDWEVAADALELVGAIHHAQQIRSLLHLARDSFESPLWPDRPLRDQFSEYRPLGELAQEAAIVLRGGPAPKVIWGAIRATDDGAIVYDSIYAHGFSSLPVEMLPNERRLASGETQRYFRTKYLGHRYSGQTRDYFLVAHRGAALRASPRRRRVAATNYR